MGERKRCKMSYFSKSLSKRGNAKRRKRQTSSRTNKQANAEVVFKKTKCLNTEGMVGCLKP